LHNTLANARNTTFEQCITSLNKDDYTIWKATEKFKRPQISILSIRKAEGSWAKSDLERAENFAEYLSLVFTPQNSNDHHNDNETEKFLDTPCQMSLPIKAFSPKEVELSKKKTLWP
jgi:hypothetical protein